jgi:hypothetical protein
MPRELIRAGAMIGPIVGLAVRWPGSKLSVHGPGDVQGDPVVHGDEMSRVRRRHYALDADGRRMYDSAFFSRPKGGDKSGLIGRGSVV